MFTTYIKSVLPIAAFLLLIALATHAQNNVVQKFETGQVDAGIEVGSKGVKMSLLELDTIAGYEGKFRILKDTSINAEFISFTHSSYQATLSVLDKLYQTADSRNNIPPAHVFTAISSGLYLQAQKEDKKIWIDQLSMPLDY